MKTLVCIFAHPDDEAFGPGGTIAKLSKRYDVYILCATKGEAGINSKNKEKAIAAIREKELVKSAKILGVKKVYFLGFEDGTLSNNLYHKLAEKIKEKLLELRPETIMTDEPRGVSGHIDHIVVSMATTFVFYQLPFLKTLWYYCLSERARAKVKNYFIYFPPGYKKSEIDKIVSIKDVWATKVKAMYAHQSQKHDIEKVLHNQKTLPRKEYFLVASKK